MAGPTLELARALVSRRSVTPADAGCLDLLGQRLARLGFGLERMDGGGVCNLLAQRGSGSPWLVFAGHTDVVPPGPAEQWTSDPFMPEVRDGFLYGRGAADMKGSIAAFVTAVERFLAGNPRHAGRIGLLLTSDEEGPAIEGTARMVAELQRRGERPDFCIVGEPTSESRLADTVKNGRRGSLSGRLLVKGVQGHIAYPHLLRNPIHAVAPALAELAATAWDEGNAHFPPTSWQASNFHAGTGADNVVPGTAEILFNFRFSTASTPEGLRQRTQAILDRHGLEYALDWTLSGKPYLTPSGRLVDQVSQAIREIAGLEPALSTGGGTSDGRFIADICPEVVELGPLNRTIHKIDECVAVADLDTLSRIYERVLELLL
ncbi:MAG TPA: succinyl-diaminopimelate desuccinylase [Candidatus Desulfobacillus sp.]|nr:succinyl-diaminopimelate desuccinylase [Candidatus Desulfobacillus sp.]